MYKLRKTYLFSLVPLIVALAISALGTGFLFSQSSHANPHAKVTYSYERGSTHIVFHHVVNVGKLPLATPAKSQSPLPDLPLSVDPKKIAQLDDLARHNPNAPHSPQVLGAPGRGPTPVAFTNFPGQSENCRCAPPDMGLAASPSFVLQGVNDSFAVYNTSGALQPGFPVSAQSFFGIPNDCSGKIPPSLSDPRALYDPNDQRFWAAIEQFPIFFCPPVSLSWIAVSQTSDPRGAWNVYAFDPRLGTRNIGDFPQLGFDGQAVYWSLNMFNPTETSFLYSEIFEGNKHQMENNGVAFTADFFRNLMVCAKVCIAVDTVQPVMSEGGSTNADVRAEFFVNTFNNGPPFGPGTAGDPFGNDCVTASCSSLIVWAFSNPIAHDIGGSLPTLTMAFVDTNAYSFPPLPGEPGRSSFFRKQDLRVSGTPVYRDGFVDLAWVTNASNGIQNVAAVEWSQIKVGLTDTDPTCTSTFDVCADIDASSTFQFQGGYLVYVGNSGATNGAAYYPVLMPDDGDNLFMLFEYSDAVTNPEVAYIARRATFALNNFDGAGLVLRVGDAPYTFLPRWGDYEAASYDGPATNNVWFAGEYATASGDWATWIGKDQFSLFNP